MMLPMDQQGAKSNSSRMTVGMRVGPYEITDFIGAGAIGQVYRAHDTNLNRVVALKMLPIELSSDTELLHRFEEEARAAKNPAERYALTRDSARDLGSAREHLHELLGSRRIRPRTKIPGQNALAVLPVINLSGDPQHEAFADAMTDALITELTRVGGLRVISRTSSMAYKGRRNGLPEVAEELGVDLILLASSVVAGSQVRIAAQLVDASDDENRWASSYTRSMRRVLTMQSQVAAAIASEVQHALAPKDRVAVIDERPPDPPARANTSTSKHHRQCRRKSGVVSTSTSNVGAHSHRQGSCVK
jgi:TolB-like protein